MENEVKVKEQKQNEEKSFASINIKSFATVAILLVVILAICGAMSYFIPQGYYQMAEDIGWGRQDLAAIIKIMEQENEK